MVATSSQPFPKLRQLPLSFPKEGAVSIEIDEGVPIFRASLAVQDRIEVLLEKQKAGLLSDDELEEINRYEEIDDYLSLLNRVVRNQLHAP